ncbi:MAG: VanZ family protein [Acidobacteria bacterium]|nr:VanZ family protein [Acidobacteriota bacterium]
MVLLTWSLALVFVTLFVSGGKGVHTNLDPLLGFRQMAALARSGGHVNALVYVLLAIAANLLAFAVWAFLVWKLLKSPERGWLHNHVDTLLLGLLFSSGIEVVQLFLPTRAFDVNDLFWNLLGVITGSLAAHAHAAFRVEWE